MERSLAFSKRAAADLRDIALFIAADSPAQALRFTSELRERCRGLSAYPARYRIREEYGADVRVAVHGRYLIFYAERGDTIVVERIIHGARHLDGLQI